MEYLKLDIAEGDIEKVFEPYIIERYAEGSPAWDALVEENMKCQRRRRLRRQLLGWIPTFRRTQAGLQKAFRAVKSHGLHVLRVRRPGCRASTSRRTRRDE